MNRINDLFASELHAVNLGLESFTIGLKDTGAPVQHVDWRPPAGGDAELGARLVMLFYDSEACRRTEAANNLAMERILSAHSKWVGVSTAREAMAIEANQFLHAGPPIAYRDMCGPMKGAALGAVLFEKLAANPEEAVALLENGGIQFAPCHDYHAVGPMAGIISPSMPVLVVRNETGGNLAFTNVNEGLGKVLRFGAFDSEVLSRLSWIKDVLAPALASVITEDNPVDLRAISAKALHMGDEGHNRNAAASALLFKELTGRLLAVGADQKATASVLAFVAANDHFYLNLSMAACKAVVDGAAGIPDCTVITAMSRNGVEFGVRMSATGDTWFTAPADIPKGLYFPGYSEADAAPDLGDSSITETAGLGAFAMAAAPAIIGFVGGTSQDALNTTRQMYSITLRRNTNYSLPFLNFEGAPIGIDARKVVDTGITPVINTGIAHKNAGVGQVGAGIVHAPMACFVQAMREFLSQSAH
jgi:hypothetical protein